MTFLPIANYSGHNHVLQVGAHWTHPTSGYTYACACEQKSGARQNLSVYRMKPGGVAWEHVKTYFGTIDSEGHITMGGASIEPSGAMLVTTSLIIKGAQKVTTTGFQGCWVRKAGVDDPYTLGATARSPIPLGPALTDFLSPTSATASLYDKSYLPTDLDTPNKLALRITKQLFALNEQGAAIREIVEALRKQGVLG